jgi:hypothetical protein
MASIVGENIIYKDYYNANGWQIGNTISSWLSSLTTDFRSVEATITNPQGLTSAQQAAMADIGVLGLPKPWGAVIIIGAVCFIGFAGYKILK